MMATQRKDDLRVKEIPDVVVDPGTRKRYMKGRFLGKGGFAKCYELTDMVTKEVWAGKIVSKSLLVKPHQKEKMTQEIEIHRTLSHKHIVKFHTFFEDADNVYILLELCRRKSLMELHKRRKAVTEPEAKYFVQQIARGCAHLHTEMVIHRDLKLGNLFLNDDMEIKIGDFGLATRLEHDAERKRTLCGTPNYIAPEVLGKKGHSYEVDSWSLGCIVYTLLVGKPPFETSCLKDTYQRIKRNEYHIPSARVGSTARILIQKMLKSDPGSRPTMDQVLQDDWFTEGFTPQAIPTSCLTMAPRFDMMMKRDTSMRKPLVDINSVQKTRAPSSIEKDSDKNAAALCGSIHKREEPADYWLSDLLSCLTSVVASKPSEMANVREDDALYPAASPVYWVSKWVDYSDKYGLGYQLCDSSVGVLFNDSTRLLLTSNGDNVQYIERDGNEHLHSLKVYPETLNKKITLLKYFRNYMSEHLLKAGANMTPRESDDMTRLPFLRTWFRTRSAIVLHLSNGTLQINFFQDHTKIIVCPLMGAATYIDEKRDFRVFNLSSIEKYGCSKEVASRLRYARTMVERLISSKSGSGKSVKSAS